MVTQMPSLKNYNERRYGSGQMTTIKMINAAVAKTSHHQESILIFFFDVASSDLSAGVLP